MQKFGFGWPDNLNCEKFPVAGLCVGVSATGEDIAKVVPTLSLQGSSISSNASSLEPFDDVVSNAATSHMPTIRDTEAPSTVLLRDTEGPSTKKTSVTKHDNDNSPVFKHLVVFLREDVPVGTRITAMQTTNQDSNSIGSVKYELIAGDTNNRFGIDANNGVMFTRSTFNYDVNNTYELVVRAVDHGTTLRATTVTMTVSLVEVLENRAAVTTWKLTFYTSILFTYLM